MDPANHAQPSGEPDPDRARDDPKPRRLQAWLPTILGVLLVVIASVRRLHFVLLGGRSYADSPLGVIELMLAAVLLLLVCSWLVRLAVLAIRRRWRDVRIAALNVACGLALILLAMIIDPLTLASA